MPGKKPQSGLRLYARLLHEVSEINRALPPHKQLSLQQRREFISQKIYPLYKDVPGYKFRITEARATITRRIKRLPKRDNVDVTLVPEEMYDEIDYFSIDGFLGGLLKDWSINVQVIGGNFGNTEIFNTRDYNYEASGVSDITNAINTFVRNRPRKPPSGYFFYSGWVQLKPGRTKNDGKPENYYLALVLQMGQSSAKKIEPLDIPVDKTKKKKKRKLKEKKKAKEILQKRIKAIKFARSKVKRVRQNLLKELKDFKNLVNKKYISAKEKKTYAKRAYNLEKAKLERHLKSGTISERKYEELLAKIKKGYGQKKG